MIIMGKRFIKFRVSKVIPSFKSCRSKDSTSLPSNPNPSFLHKLKHTNTPPDHHTPQHHHKPHHHFSLKRHVSSAIISARRSFSRPRCSHESSRTQSSLSSSLFKWEKQPKWHVIAKIPDISAYECNYDSNPPRRKIYNSSASENDVQNDVVLFPPLKLQKRRRTRRRRRSFRKVSDRNSTSSDSGLFTDGDDETENLVSTDSSTSGGAKRRMSAAGEAAPARLSEFMRRMVPCKAVDEVAEGKVRESFAVVKRSEDPYEDFKRSMVEMVVEMQMFEKSDLEELLRCFLSLNSECHHGVIVRAFVEIWEGLFCYTPSSSYR